MTGAAHQLQSANPRVHQALEREVKRFADKYAALASDKAAQRAQIAGPQFEAERAAMLKAMQAKQQRIMDAVRPFDSAYQWVSDLFGMIPQSNLGWFWAASIPVTVATTVIGYLTKDRIAAAGYERRVNAAIRAREAGIDPEQFSSGFFGYIPTWAKVGVPLTLLALLALSQRK